MSKAARSGPQHSEPASARLVLHLSAASQVLGARCITAGLAHPSARRATGERVRGVNSFARELNKRSDKKLGRAESAAAGAIFARANQFRGRARARQVIAHGMLHKSLRE